MNILKEIWILVFGLLLIYLIYDGAINYSIETGYNVYDIFAIMIVTPILVNIYIYIVYKFLKKFKI